MRIGAVWGMNEVPSVIN